MINGVLAVPGCSQCPYLTMLNDGSGNLTSGECGHPIHNKELGRPKIDLKILQKDYKEGVKVVNPESRPDWCPLS